MDVRFPLSRRCTKQHRCARTCQALAYRWSVSLTHRFPSVKWLLHSAQDVFGSWFNARCTQINRVGQQVKPIYLSLCTLPLALLLHSSSSSFTLEIRLNAVSTSKSPLWSFCCIKCMCLGIHACEGVHPLSSIDHDLLHDPVPSSQFSVFSATSTKRWKNPEHCLPPSTNPVPCFPSHVSYFVCYCHFYCVWLLFGLF